MMRSAFVVAAGVLAGCLMAPPAYATEVTLSGSIVPEVNSKGLLCYTIRMAGPITVLATAAGAVTTGSLGDVGFETVGRPTDRVVDARAFSTDGNLAEGCVGGVAREIRDGEMVYTVSAVGARGDVVLVLRCWWRNWAARCV